MGEDLDKIAQSTNEFIEKIGRTPHTLDETSRALSNAYSISTRRLAVKPAEAHNGKSLAEWSFLCENDKKITDSEAVTAGVRANAAFHLAEELMKRGKSMSLCITDTDKMSYSDAIRKATDYIDSRPAETWTSKTGPETTKPDALSLIQPSRYDHKAWSGITEVKDSTDKSLGAHLAQRHPKARKPILDSVFSHAEALHSVGAYGSDARWTEPDPSQGSFPATRRAEHGRSALVRT